MSVLRWLTVSLLVAVLLPHVSALIEYLEIIDDDRTAFHIESFGYEPGGQYNFVLQEFELRVPASTHDGAMRQKFDVAFILEHSDSDTLRLSDSEFTSGGCLHKELPEGADVHVIDISERSQWGLYRYKHPPIEEPGYYHTYFSNCEPHTRVSFKLTLEEYNVDAKGQRSYLSAGEASLPTWLFVLTGVYTVQLIVWAVVVRRNPIHVRAIHHLMTLVVLLKIVTSFFEAFRYHSLNTLGHTDGWSYVFYVFSFIKGMLMFGVIVLIGTGWSYLKPFLTDRDKNLMLVVLVVQVMVNIAMVVVDERAPGSSDWVTWREILHLLDIICCCVILLPIVWSIRHLRSATGTDGKAGRNMERLKNFRSFYLLVVSYVYFTRIIVFLLSATLPFEWVWLATVISEAATLAFFATTGYLFRPQSASPYLQADTEDLDDGRPEGRSPVGAEPSLTTLPEL